MLWFTLATAVPVFLLTPAGVFGGAWTIAALLYLPTATFLRSLYSPTVLLNLYKLLLLLFRSKSICSIRVFTKSPSHIAAPSDDIVRVHLYLFEGLLYSSASFFFFLLLDSLSNILAL